MGMLILSEEREEEFFGFEFGGDGDTVRMLISSREREKGVSVTKYHVILSGGIGSLAHVGRKEHLNRVILFRC
jgi:hypothetical protein